MSPFFTRASDSFLRAVREITVARVILQIQLDSGPLRVKPGPASESLRRIHDSSSHIHFWSTLQFSLKLLFITITDGGRITMKIFLTGSLALVLALGCGGEGGGGGGSSLDGTLTETWTGFCEATFTEDFVVSDSFDDTLFTAKKDEVYLMGGWSQFGGELKADLLYLTAGAPVEFTVSAADVESAPFTSNCTPGETTSYLGVFGDVTFYVDEAMTEQACQLEDGTHAPGNVNSRLVSGLDFSNPNADAVYSVGMGELSEQCGGHETTFVLARPQQLFGSSNVSAPLARVITPKM